MSATTVPAASKLTASVEARERGHVGLIVLASIASDLVLGLVLVLGVFGGGTEAQITGGALIASLRRRAVRSRHRVRSARRR